MAFLLKQIYGFIKLLNSDTGLNQIAAGIACGFVLGMTPAFSLQTLLIFFCLFIFRIQMGAAFLTGGLFALFAFFLDPVFDRVGGWVLELPALQGVFTQLYHMPIIPFTRFYNTVVMGSGVVALALSPLVFILGRVLVQKYREKIATRIQNSKWFKSLKSTALYEWYSKYENIKGMV